MESGIGIGGQGERLTLFTQFKVKCFSKVYTYDGIQPCTSSFVKPLSVSSVGYLDLSMSLTWQVLRIRP